jgi:hypothetical protein
MYQSEFDLKIRKMSLLFLQEKRKVENEILWFISHSRSSNFTAIVYNRSLFENLQYV